MKLPRTPFAKRRLIDTVSSTGKLRVADDTKACTATISPHNATQISDFVHHVDQERAPSGLPPPRAILEILVRFTEHLGADDGHQAPEPAIFRDLDRLGHDRIVLSMMSRQQLHVGALGRLAKPRGILDRIRQRLLDESGYACRNTGKALLDVKSIGRC
jgi:hypothetical protein